MTCGMYLKYSHVHLNNKLYIYREHIKTEADTMKSANAITKWVEDLCRQFENEHKYKVYSCGIQATVSFEELVRDDFLFYSIDDAQEYKEYLIAESGTIAKNYSDLNDWSAKNGNGIIISNDADGIGLYFYFNDSAVPCDWWLMHYLSRYKFRAFYYNV
jgi:hypothetical protein